MTWLPGYERIAGESAGSWRRDPNPAPRLVWHTTEGSSADGAIAAYRANNSWPHVTVDPRRRRLIQHLPLDVPARALKNTSVPGETNREPVTIQVEVVATARTRGVPKGLVSVADLTPDELAWLGREVAGPISRAVGIPLTTSVRFVGQDAGWTLAHVHAKQRLSGAQWDTYAGHLGHQHVPENTHWDPGPLNIAAVLAAAGATTRPPAPKPQEGLNMAQATEINRRIDRLRDGTLLLVRSLEARIDLTDKRIDRLRDGVLLGFRGEAAERAKLEAALDELQAATSSARTELAELLELGAAEEG